LDKALNFFELVSLPVKQEEKKQKKKNNHSNNAKKDGNISQGYFGHQAKRYKLKCLLNYIVLCRS